MSPLGWLDGASALEIWASGEGGWRWRFVSRSCIPAFGPQRSFAFETTLSDRGHLRLIRRLRAAGWRVELIYLALPSVELSILRVAERVAHGGHNVPLPVLQRRFPRSIRLLLDAYAPAVDQAICNVNDGATPKPVFFQTGVKRTILDAMLYAQHLELAR